jgi:KaiC/GvpD/RAD55 family RecA-like ATPase
LVSTGVSGLNEILDGDGYPSRSAVLIVGQPGIGKEAVSYWFIQSGLGQNDFCLYATRLSVDEVVRDERAFGIVPNPGGSSRLVWLASGGCQVKLDVNDLVGILDSIEGILRKNSRQKVRIVVDFLSTLLMLNPADTVYRFVSQLTEEVKRYDAVLLATIEDGMHPPKVLTAMEQLFDGYVELSLYRSGLRVLPLLRIGKMRGVAPQPDLFFRFRFVRGAGLLIERTEPETFAHTGV